MADSEIAMDALNWDLVHLYNIDPQNFTIYLTSAPQSYQAEERKIGGEPGVEYQASNQFIKNLHMLSSIDNTRPILVHMTICGGNWDEGMAMFDNICACPNPVIILGHTHVESMAAIILQAADRRVLMPNSHMMIHDVSTSVSESCTAKEIESRQDWHKQVIMPTAMRIYVDALKRGGKFARWPVDKIGKMLRDCIDARGELYLTAPEAVDWGFADAVFNANNSTNFSL